MNDYIEKDYSELVSRFDHIQDLPVSEELLGAYLEGHLSLYEMEEMGIMISQDPMLKSIVEEISTSTLIDIDDLNQPIDDKLDNDFSEIEFNENNVDFFNPELQPDSIDEPAIEIESSDYDYDTLIDDPTFELPDLPFFKFFFHYQIEFESSSFFTNRQQKRFII